MLPLEAVRQLGLGQDTAPEELAVVVISHSCDVVGGDPSLEIIVGRFLIGNPNGTLEHARNPRKLHLTCSGGETARAVELEISGRRTLFKDDADGVIGLARFRPCPVHALSAPELRILQEWLACRYRRSAFPEEFDRRLKDETGTAERLARALEDDGHYVPAVYFDIDEGTEIEHQGEDDTYTLRIALLYSSDEDPDVAEAAATRAANRIREIFERRCLRHVQGGPAVWKWIELADVDVISDQVMTVARAQKLTRWRAEYLSLRGDQPMLNDDNL